MKTFSRLACTLWLYFLNMEEWQNATKNWSLILTTTTRAQGADGDHAGGHEKLKNKKTVFHLAPRPGRWYRQWAIVL